MVGLPSKRLYIGIGDADAGKTTLLEALRKALGTLCPKAQPDIFDAGRPKGSRGLSPELACFEAPARIVIIDELEGRRLTVQTIKTITDAYELTYTPMFSKPVTRRRTATAVVVSNYESRPPLDLHDSGMRSRVMPIPYPAVPPNARDPGYKNRMNQSDRAAALLAKLVETCAQLPSYIEPPPPPGEVVAELNSLVRAEAGKFGVFAKRIVPAAGKRLAVEVAWTAWCKACGRPPDSKKEVGGIQKGFLSRQLQHFNLDLPKAKPAKVDGKTVQAWQDWDLLKEEPDHLQEEPVEAAPAAPPPIDWHASETDLSKMLASPSHWEGDGPLPNVLPSVQDLVSFAASGKVPQATWTAVLKSAMKAHTASGILLPAASWALIGASLLSPPPTQASEPGRVPLRVEQFTKMPPGPFASLAALRRRSRDVGPTTGAKAQLGIGFERLGSFAVRINLALEHQDLVWIHAIWRRCPTKMKHPLHELVVSWRREIGG